MQVFLLACQFSLHDENLETVNYTTLTNNRMTEVDYYENNDLLNAHSNNPGSESESHILKQEALDEQIKRSLDQIVREFDSAETRFVACSSSNSSPSGEYQCYF